jgi:hypothetical protein
MTRTPTATKTPGGFDPVRVTKDTDGDTSEASELANLWLCQGASCTLNGEGFLDVNEVILNVAGDPDGVGAFEFQVKYDNHVFGITIDPTSWLYDTGRVPGAAGIGGCSATILTENDIRFGCVSKNPGEGGLGAGNCGDGIDNDGDMLVDTADPECHTIGNMADGVAAVLHVTPKSDLSKRITPGNDNGVIRTILDEGCEVADIFGHPLSHAGDPSFPDLGFGPGYDALGREIPLDGIEPGGQVTDCADLTVTVRILEGDLNLDCTVDVLDDQATASHYGGVFGSLLYDPWYDLEPALKDLDVDVKDMQKVFGRNGSTCASPVPPQPPLLQPGDP